MITCVMTCLLSFMDTVTDGSSILRQIPGQNKYLNFIVAMGVNVQCWAHKQMRFFCLIVISSASPSNQNPYLFFVLEWLLIFENRRRWIGRGCLSAQPSGHNKPNFHLIIAEIDSRIVAFVFCKQ